jgi:RND family efflux transporter MFP subunit
MYKHFLPIVLLILGVAGCGGTQAQPPMGPPPTPEALVSLPVIKVVTDYEEFPGRLEAVNSVDVRARVSGYLEKMHFTEGAYVKKDDLLFEIDPRQYRAELARSEGTVIQSEGHLRRLESDYHRATTLLPKGAIGEEDYDRIVGDRSEATGALAVAKAARDLANLNLSYTKVRAFLSGRIGRRMIDPGNMVKADDTVLTTIVSLDPIYAYFDVDERTTLRLQRLVRAQKLKSPEAGVRVEMGLADEEGFPLVGNINFSDNHLDADTGTWRLRGLFKNPDLALSPGMFVRLRLPTGEPYKATLVSEQALNTDQGQKFVFVVDPTNKVSYRHVKVGKLHSGLRVITDGLKPDERIVVSGLQRVQHGVQIKPKEVPMEGNRQEGSGDRGQGTESSRRG